MLKAAALLNAFPARISARSKIQQGWWRKDHAQACKLETNPGLAGSIRKAKVRLQKKLARVHLDGVLFALGQMQASAFMLPLAAGSVRAKKTPTPRTSSETHKNGPVCC